MEMNHNNHHRHVTGMGIGNGNTSFQSNTSSSSSHSHSHSHSLTHSHSHSQNNNNNNNNNQFHEDTSSSSDPMQSWWESLSKSRSRIQSLLSLLPKPDTETEPNNSFPSPALIDSDCPARSLLDSFDVFTALSSSLTGSGDDPLCHWLYDTYQFPETDDLRLVVLSFIPVLTGIYLTRVHACSTTTPSPDSPSLAGFEAVLLAIYSSQTKLRGGKGVVVNIPTPEYLAGFPSLYHSVPGGKLSNSPKEGSIGVGVLCPPLEPQVGIKSTKRAFIIGVVFQSYYAQISQMPSWSKIELCKFAASWAGHDCPCVLSLQDDRDDNRINNNNSLDSFSNEGEGEGEGGDGDKGVRIPLPWEILQPMLRILGHCLLAPPPLVSDEVKEAAAVAVSRLYARASHDLDPQAILATRALVQLHGRARAAAEAAAFANASSTVTTPTSVKKSPEMLLVSQ